MGERPSLHEIAAMPFPASRDTMRKFYNPDWGRPLPEDGGARVWKITADYSYSVDAVDEFEVEADSEEEAIAEAKRLILADLSSDVSLDTCDIDAVAIGPDTIGGTA